jgi:tRNA(fMet)-specific endonuclease VapC
MHLPALIEPLTDRPGFQARLGEPFNLRAEADSPDEAVRRLIQNLLVHQGDRLAISVITVEEQLSGWQRALSQGRDDARRADVYRRMAIAVESLSGWEVLGYSETAMVRHATLLCQRLNVGSNDLKIAATALELGATVLTRNRRDFARVAGLQCQDWSV